MDYGAGTLTPVLDRLVNDVDDDKLRRRIEVVIAERFRQRAPNYLPVPELRHLDEGPGLLMLMRHYGAPTRLLDWTESVWIGLYFACCETAKTARKEEGKTVWVDEPGVLWVFDRLSFDTLADKLHGHGTKDVLITNARTGLPLLFDRPYHAWVCRLRPQGPRIPRLIVQQGFFTIGGCLRVDHAKAIDRILPDGNVNGNGNKQIIRIAPGLKDQVLKELDRMGINGNSLFPGIDCVGAYLRECARWGPLDTAVCLSVDVVPPQL